MSSESPEGPPPSTEPGEQAAAQPLGPLDALIEAALAAPADPDEAGWTVSRVAMVSALGMLLIMFGALGAAGALALLRGPTSGPISAADRALIANPGAGISPDVAATVAAPRPTGLVAPAAGPPPGSTDRAGTAAARARSSSAPGSSRPASTTPAVPRTCTVSQQIDGRRARWVLVAVTSESAARGRAWELVFDLPAGDVVVRLWGGTFRQVGRQVTVDLGRERIRAGDTRRFAYQVAGRPSPAGTGFALDGRLCAVLPAPAR